MTATAERDVWLSRMARACRHLDAHALSTHDLITVTLTLCEAAGLALDEFDAPPLHVVGGGRR